MRILFMLFIVLTVGALYLFALPLMSKERPTANFEGLSGDPVRGEYVMRTAGCIACHTDSENEGELLAGGAAIDTPFGEFYSPNITPDAQFGIGGWSLEDFYFALTAGLSPEQEHYYPAFPYTSYSKMSITDIADLKAYLDTVPPIAKSAKQHKLSWPFSNRDLLGIWKFLNLETLNPMNQRSEVDRGAYLVNGPGHCAECHSDRNFIGGLDKQAKLRGTKQGPDNQPVPAISGPNADIKTWDKVDLVFYFQTGVRPDGDVAGGSMVEVINESTSFLTDDDLNAIAAFLLVSK